MKRRPLKYTRNVIGLALVFFSALRYFMTYAAVSLGLSGQFWAWLRVYALTLAASCLTAAFIITKFTEINYPVRAGRPELRDLVIRLAALLLMEGAGIVNQLIVGALGKAGIRFAAPELMKTQGALQLIAYFIYIAVLPAIFEEYLLRGVIFRVLSEYGTRFAILASAMIFAFMHPAAQNLLTFFAAGVLLACIYSYTGTLAAPMLLHFMNNAVSFMVLYMERNTSGFSAAGFATFIVLLLIVRGSVSIWLLWKSRNNFLEPLFRKERNEKVGRLFSAPVFLMGMACLLLTILNRLYADLIGGIH